MKLKLATAFLTDINIEAWAQIIKKKTAKHKTFFSKLVKQTSCWRHCNRSLRFWPQNSINTFDKEEPEKHCLPSDILYITWHALEQGSTTSH